MVMCLWAWTAQSAVRCAPTTSLSLFATPLYEYRLIGVSTCSTSTAEELLVIVGALQSILSNGRAGQYQGETLLGMIEDFVRLVLVRKYPSILIGIVLYMWYVRVFGIAIYR